MNLKNSDSFHGKVAWIDEKSLRCEQKDKHSRRKTSNFLHWKKWDVWKEFQSSCHLTCSIPWPKWVTVTKSFWPMPIFQRRKFPLQEFVNLTFWLWNFFRSHCSEGPKLVDASGHNIPDLLEAILKFFPLDTYVFNPVVLMDLVNSDKKKDMEVILKTSREISQKNSPSCTWCPNTLF